MVTITTSFLASITFGLRPEKDASSISNYEDGAGIAAGIVSVFVWFILGLWISLIAFYTAFIKLRILEEKDADEGEEEPDKQSFQASACKFLLNKLTVFHRLRQVKEERMSMSVIYKVGFSTMAVLNVLTAFASIITHFLGQGDATFINSSTGLFFILLTEQMLPFGRAKLSFLRRAGKEGCMSCNQHLVSTGVIGSTVMGPMVLVASQGVSCLLTDFSGGRGGKKLLYDKNNCDSIFTANRCLMLMFVYVTFQGVAFGWQNDMPTLEEIVRMEINSQQ
ncbi:hypothetical protein TrRE_jg988, partial [Triparma retinervis]